ncbi:MAG: nucleotidyltransferase family protein [Patescibacteria group bacterium]
MIKKHVKTAVILASGLGTRLRPLTYSLPKPLVEVNGKPLIEYTLDRISLTKISDVIITVRYFPEKFYDRYKNNYKHLKVKFIELPENNLLGTGGDLKKTENFIHENEDILVCNADIVTNLDFSKLLNFHKNGTQVATLALVNKNEDAYAKSIGIDDNFNITEAARNKYGNTKTKLVFASQHIINKAHLKLIPENVFWGLFGDDDLYTTLLTNKEDVKAFIYPQNTLWEDVGTSERLERIKKILEVT